MKPCSEEGRLARRFGQTGEATAQVRANNCRDATGAPAWFAATSSQALCRRSQRRREHFLKDIFNCEFVKQSRLIRQTRSWSPSKGRCCRPWPLEIRTDCEGLFFAVAAVAAGQAEVCRLQPSFFQTFYKRLLHAFLGKFWPTAALKAGAAS